MKKILLVGVLCMGLFVGCKKETKKETKIEEPKVEIKKVMSLDEYKDITLDKIESINFIKFTEAGREDELITDKDRIRNIYNNLSALVIKGETEQSCDDNTEIYEFKLTDGTTSKLEIECDWVIINNKRYLIK